MKKILINLKDYFDINENEKFEEFIRDLPVVVFPSLPYLYIYKDMSKASVGVQRLCTYESGAHTGSVSVEHLEDFNVAWALINHREARRYNKEELGSKISVSLNDSLSTVVCFRDEEEFNDILDIINNIDINGELYLAYEPIVNKDVDVLNNEIKIFKTKLNNVKFVYGGNISKDNILEFNSKLDVDGFLISRHALNTSELTTIISLLKK